MAAFPQYIQREARTVVPRGHTEHLEDGPRYDSASGLSFADGVDAPTRGASISLIRNSPLTYLSYQRRSPSCQVGRVAGEQLPEPGEASQGCFVRAVRHSNTAGWVNA